MSGKIAKVRLELRKSTLDKLFIQASDSGQHDAVDMALKLGREDIAIEIIEHTLYELKKGAVDLALKLGGKDPLIEAIGHTICKLQVNLESCYQSLEVKLEEVAQFSLLTEPITFITPAFSIQEENSSLNGESDDISDC